MTETETIQALGQLTNVVSRLDEAFVRSQEKLDERFDQIAEAFEVRDAKFNTLLQELAEKRNYSPKMLLGVITAIIAVATLAFSVAQYQGAQRTAMSEMRNARDVAVTLVHEERRRYTELRADSLREQEVLETRLLREEKQRIELATLRERLGMALAMRH